MRGVSESAADLYVIPALELFIYLYNVLYLPRPIVLFCVIGFGFIASGSFLRDNSALEG